jgi:phage-related minor tail protein
MGLQVGELQVALGLDDSPYKAGQKQWRNQAEADGKQTGQAMSDSFGQSAKGATAKAEAVGKKSGQGFQDETEKGANGLGDKLSGLMDKIGPAIAGAAGAIGLAAGGAFVASLVMDAETQQDRLAASIGLNESSAKLAGQVAGKVYASGFGESMEDVSKATAAVLAANLTSIDDDPAFLEDMTKKALNFASVFEVDVNRAVGTAAQLINSGLAKDGTEAMDLLTRAAQKVPVALREDVMDAVDEYSQFFGTLGISGPEAMDLLVKASAKGMYGIDKTGDALKELTIRSTDMSAASVDAYKAAGLNAEQMAAQFSKGGAEGRDALGKLIDGLLGIQDPVKRSNAAIGLFGTPLEDLNAQEIPAFLNELKNMGRGMKDVEGAADRMGETLSSNTANKIETLKRKGFDYLRKGGEALASFFEEKVIPAFEWFVDNKPVLVGALTAAAIAIGSVVVPAFIAWATAAWSAAAGVIAATWPVLAIAAAIGLLVAGLIYAYQNWDWFRGAVDAVASFLKDTVWPVLKETGVMLFNVIGAAVRWVADLWSNTLWPALQSVGSWISGTLWPILQTLGGIIGKYVVTHIQTLVWIWSNVLYPALQLVWAFLSGPVKAAFQVLGQFIGDVFGPIVRTLALVWSNVLQPAFSAVVGFIRSTVLPAISSISSTVFAVASTIGTIVGNIVGFFRDLGGNIAGAIGGLAGAISSPFTTAFNRVKDLWNNTVGGISFTIPDWVPGLGGRGWTFPKMHTGGVVTPIGGEGSEVLRLLQVGETVRTNDQERSLQRALSLGRAAALQLGTAAGGEGSSQQAAAQQASAQGGNTWTGNQINHTDADPDKIAVQTVWRLKTSGAA